MPGTCPGWRKRRNGHGPAFSMYRLIPGPFSRLDRHQSLYLEADFDVREKSCSPLRPWQRREDLLVPRAKGCTSRVQKAGTNFRSDLCMSNGKGGLPTQAALCSEDKPKGTPREAGRCQPN